MSWNPLNTLTGRMVLVTIIAVALSYAAAFALFANERGAALRRAAETAVTERIAFTTERLSAAPADDRAAIAANIRDFSILYSIDDAPAVDRSARAGPAARIARSLVERLAAEDVRAHAQTVEGPSRRWRIRDRDREGFERRRGGPEPSRRDILRREARERTPVRSTEVTVSIPLEDGAWLNAITRLPGPRPAPLSVLFGALVAVLATGIGAALVARQIGKPLAELADAAQALGAGETDVTASVRGPADVRRASSAFNAMAQRLGRQLGRQRQMLWALSHDLRTPITALKLRAELVEDESARERLLAPIAEMERLTEQALSLARAGASEEERVSVDLAEIARTLCGELRDMGLDVRAEAPDEVRAECRPSEVARALRNLAENAAKYGGGGVMRVWRTAEGEAAVEIYDQGPGVPEHLIAQLTAPFFRADEARSGGDGAGLGLAITQAIAEAHGGRLILANRKPRGFSATLVLPG